MLREMSRSQWLEWMEWVSIRGPIGGARTDFYTSFLAMHASAAGQQKGVTVRQYRMPWIKEEDLTVYE